MGGRTRSSSRTRRLIDGFGSGPSSAPGQPSDFSPPAPGDITSISPDFRASDAVALLSGALAHRREYGTRRHPSRSWIRRTSGRQTRSPAWHRGNRSTQRRSARRAPPTGLSPSHRRRNSRSSHAVISVWRWPKPPGGTPIRMRTGKRRSAMVIISRGWPGMLEVPSLFLYRSHAGSTVSSPLGPSARLRYGWIMCGRARLSSDVSEIKLVFSIPPHRPTRPQPEVT